MQLPRAPDLSFALGADYEFTVFGDRKATLSANDRYTSKYDLLPGAGGPLQLSRQQAYHLVSLGLSVEDEHTGLEARLFVNNLTRSRYYLDIPTSAFGIAGSAAPPRTFVGSLAYHFGGARS